MPCVGTPFTFLRIIGMKYPYLLLSLIMLLSPASHAALWFTDQPPDKSLLKQLRSAHGGLVKMENNVYHKQLWLRKGDSLAKSAYVEPLTNNPFYVMDTQQKAVTPNSKKIANNTVITFAMPDEGFYNAYYTERTVSDDILHINTAKAEVLKHNCREGHNYDRKLVKPNQWTETPLEIVRLRLPAEDFHTRIQSGNLIKFTVLYQGKPVSGAELTLETQHGWSKTTSTDANGIASFQIIQDNFVTEEQAEDNAETTAMDKKAWANKKTAKGEKHAEHQENKQAKTSRYNARPMDNFLVTAEYRVPETGEFKGKAYQKAVYSISMTGSYTANHSVAQSKQQALMYASAGFLTLGVGATWYRRRRIKPFKEVSFDEH